MAIVLLLVASTGLAAFYRLRPHLGPERRYLIKAAIPSPRAIAISNQTAPIAIIIGPEHFIIIIVSSFSLRATGEPHQSKLKSNQVRLGGRSDGRSLFLILRRAKGVLDAEQLVDGWQTNKDNRSAVIIPPIIGAVSRCMTSEPVPVPISRGKRPARFTAAVFALDYGERDYGGLR